MTPVLQRARISTSPGFSFPVRPPWPSSEACGLWPFASKPMRWCALCFSSLHSRLWTHKKSIDNSALRRSKAKTFPSYMFAFDRNFPSSWIGVPDAISVVRFPQTHNIPFTFQATQWELFPQFQKAVQEILINEMHCFSIPLAWMWKTLNYIRVAVISRRKFLLWSLKWVWAPR